MAQVNESSIIIQFSVSKISKLASVESSEFFLHGIPWQIDVSKFENGPEKSLSVHLCCMKEDNTSTWTATACATIRLLPFSDDQEAIEYCIPPFTFDGFNNSYGTNALIQWDNLLDDTENYVKNDTIKLEAKIEVEDPNCLNKSALRIGRIDKSCDDGCLTTFQLTSTNILNLMAVRSSQFIMRGFPWSIMLFKNDTHLGITLELMQRCRNISCEVAMSIKLVSTKENVAQFERVTRKEVKWLEDLFIGNMIPWNELLKPENGFVCNDSITLNIEIKASKPEGAASKVGVKPHQYECSICLEMLENQDISTAPCCHLFCTACITTAVRTRGFCPLCQAAVQLNDLRRLYPSV